jgi:hypothetical protein
VKIEIEFGNVAALKQQERDLMHALDAVRGALRLAEAQPPFINETFPPEMPKPFGSFVHPAQAVTGVNNNDDAVAYILQGLPQEFTTSDVLEGTKKKFHMSRGATLSALARVVESGAIKVLERGIGRRPSRYQKVDLQQQ